MHLIVFSKYLKRIRQEALPYLNHRLLVPLPPEHPQLWQCVSEGPVTLSSYGLCFLLPVVAFRNFSLLFRNFSFGSDIFKAALKANFHSVHLHYQEVDLS